MNDTNYKYYVSIFKALSDETRLKIVEMISCDEMCACDILESFEISQSTLSYHMKILTECGLVNSRKDGAWMRYQLNKEQAAKISLFWNNITFENPNCICKTTKNENVKCD